MTNPAPSDFSEKDFTKPDPKKSNFPFWVWGFLLTVFIALLWGLGSWYNNKMAEEHVMNPFLRVTNRELSLFLWQFPEYMRANVVQKTGYLPGFNSTMDKVTMHVDQAEDYAIAPPELLFLYHTWSHLIKDEFTPRPIPKEQFKEFLEKVEEWKPENWTKAPKGYADLVSNFDSFKGSRLDTLPNTSMPIQVRMAFEGWKNYFKEGVTINKLLPTYEEIRDFIQDHPHYARNFWRNIVEDTYPKYLASIYLDEEVHHGIFPPDEMAPFLKVAIYNYIHAQD